MKKNIKMYSALALGASAILPVACKKDNNDPNIIDKNIGLSLSIGASPSLKIDSIDIDGNGRTDMAFLIGTEDHDSTMISYLTSMNSNSAFIVNANYTVMTIEEGNQQDAITTSSSNLGSVALFHSKNLGSSTNIGIGGQGDKYIVFAVRDAVAAPDDIHTGWMKVNLSSDLKTLTIKDLAYQKNPGVGIKVGAK
ncbi:MAG TPA: hypothetical protein PKO18_08215 [Chitinophagales bacterium]|nr:hypothetical protein [Chitinophagales bacterium]HNL85208.1 hypothetical protein [Chitinophagales bacterium]